jgi:hypothetical protein
MAKKYAYVWQSIFFDQNIVYVTREEIAKQIPSPGLQSHVCFNLYQKFITKCNPNTDAPK